MDNNKQATTPPEDETLGDRNNNTPGARGTGSAAG